MNINSQQYKNIQRTYYKTFTFKTLSNTEK